MLDFDTIAARSLNSSRIVHKPTYAGLRLLLKAAAHRPASFLRLIHNRCRSRESWRYYSFQILKEASKDKPPVYRDCLSGSPLTTAAEAYVLGLMAAQPVFQPPSCAFSYLWPTTTRTGRSFEYFFDGYVRRNRRVATLLEENPNYLAVVTDIKSFYPNVNKERVRLKLAKCLKVVSDTTVARSIAQFVDSLLTLTSPKFAGIPIGPEVAHVLGHVALESVDAVMMKAYGDRYLRYVDDIIIVCPKSDAVTATNRLRDALAEEGLVLHDGKQDMVDEGTWRNNSISLSSDKGMDSFGLLLDEIILFLLRKPAEIEPLRQRLLGLGFSLPIRRLGSLVKSRRYRSHKRSHFRQQRGLFEWAKSWFITEASIIERATSVRESMLKLASSLAGDPIPTQPTSRKSYVQKRRYVFNRLLYLLSPNEYPRLLMLIPDADEFTEIRLAAGALAGKNGSMVLKYPGRVVDTFCQLWNEHHDSGIPLIDWPTSPSRAEAESAAHMALYFPVTPTDSFATSLSSRAPGSRILIDVCGRSSTGSHSIVPFSFLDELELLYRGISSGEVRQLVTSRFDELEELGLDALLLGGAGSPFTFDDGDYAN